MKLFKETICTWWYTSSKEALKRFPLQDKFLWSLKWLQPGWNQYTLLNQVLEATEHLPQVIKPNEISQLHEEFMDYCTSPLSPKLNRVKEVDTYWDLLGQIRDASDTIVVKIAKAVLIIPHGISDTERLFSYIGLNKTKHRSCLSIDTWNSLLTIQFYTPL